MNWSRQTINDDKGWWTHQLQLSLVHSGIHQVGALRSRLISTAWKDCDFIASSLPLCEYIFRPIWIAADNVFVAIVIYCMIYAKLIATKRLSHNKITGILSVNSWFQYFNHKLVVYREPTNYYITHFTEYWGSASSHPKFYKIPDIFLKQTHNFRFSRNAQLLATLIIDILKHLT